MVSETRKKEKSRKLGSLELDPDKFEEDKIAQVIGNTENSQGSEDEVDIGQQHQMPTSTANLGEIYICLINSRNK